MRLTEIQHELQKRAIDGWLFFDHHQRDPLAYRILGLSPERQASRRWYYFVPSQGEPRGLVHRVERSMLDALPGEKLQYSSWTEQTDGVARLLSGAKRVAMQYSPMCAIPYVSMIDAGTAEMVRSTGVELVSSADLIQLFEARWSEGALQTHLEAGRRVDRIRAEAFALISERIRNGSSIGEFEVAEFIRERFRQADLFTDHGPIIAANENSSNPHYDPTPQSSASIRAGDFVLIDMWAKLSQPGAVYYDITWTGFCGQRAAPEMNAVFKAVAGARDAAVKTVKDAVAQRQELHGYQVDDAARSFLRAAGYSEWFTHRTGHSIGEEVHGNGANMDNLEIHDDRLIVPWTCFSVEPGVYLPGFGIRSEVDVFVDEDTAWVTGEIQSALVLL